MIRDREVLGKIVVTP